MRLKRIGVLLSKEFAYGARNVLFVLALVVPVVLSLVISLLLGTVLSGKPRLGIVDAGDSQLTSALLGLDYVLGREYDSQEALTQDVEAGRLDLGLVLPAGFDQALRQRDQVGLDVYVWGESLLKHRTVLVVATTEQIFYLAGRQVPVDVLTTTLGEAADVPWDERLFPLVVLFAIAIGGVMMPATSLVDEKQKRTLRALTITPLSLGDVALAKGLMGGIVSLVMGTVILALNDAFGMQPGLLLAVLALGAAFAVEIGVLLGLLLKDVNTVFTVIKSLGILLYAPAILYMFPKLPAWIPHLFPTYYMLNPLVDLSLHGSTWTDVAPDLAVLLGLIAVMALILAAVVRREEAT